MARCWHYLRIDLRRTYEADVRVSDDFREEVRTCVDEVLLQCSVLLDPDANRLEGFSLNLVAIHRVHEDDCP